MLEQQQFFGTVQTVITRTTNLADGAVTAAGLFDNTTDSVVPYALAAIATLDVPDFSGVPISIWDLPTYIELWGVLQNTDGSEHDTDPPVSSSNLAGAMFFGEWVLDDVDAAQQRSVTISLEGVEQVEFYLLNKAGVSLTNSGGAPTTVKIRPFAYGVVL